MGLKSLRECFCGVGWLGGSVANIIENVHLMRNHAFWK